MIDVVCIDSSSDEEQPSAPTTQVTTREKPPASNKEKPKSAPKHAHKPASKQPAKAVSKKRVAQQLVECL